MKRSKPGVKYQGIAFAVPFIQAIKEHIKDDQKYRSVTDFVRQATREKMGKNENGLVDISKFNIVLRQYVRNGMRIIMSKHNMNESQVISMSLNNFFKNELSQDEINILYDDSEIDSMVEQVKQNSVVYEGKERNE